MGYSEKGIRKIFSEVAQTYELVNHVLTGGLDILWRRKAARLAARQGGTHWMDVCSGTGETAVNLRRLAPTRTLVVALDYSPAMLGQLARKPEAQQIAGTLADVKALPFPAGTFDLITISFATRNINLSREALLTALREFHRVLKPGGRFVNLETSQPSSPLIRSLFHRYVRMAVKPLGYALSGSRAGYAYLAHTIPRFYPAEEFAALIRQAGFAKVYVKPLLFGIAAIHQAVK